MSTQLAKIDGEGATVVRQEFGAVESQQQPETAATAVAARERAATEARYVMAERHPRSIDQFRVALLKECERPGFAEVARYRRPVGKTKKDGRWVDVFAEGPTIRFIEAAIREFKNVFPEVSTVFDNDNLRICRVAVTDLQNNTGYSTEVQVPKAVEKKGKQDNKGKWEPPKGRDVLGSRINSYGDMTYLVRATDDEVIIRQKALISKEIRTQAERLMPRDIIEECMARVIKTLRDQDAKDPDTAKRRLIDAFSALSVEPDDLEQYLEKKLERVQPKDLDELRSVHAAIKDGQTTWEEVVAAKNPTFGSEEEQEKVATKKLAGLRGKGKKSTKEKTPSNTKLKADEPTAEVGEGGASEPPEMTEEQMKAETAAQDSEEAPKNPFGRRSS